MQSRNVWKLVFLLAVSVTVFFRSASNLHWRILSLDENQRHQIGIIHVGKCGGTALKNILLKRRNANMIQQRNPEWIHMSQPDPFKYDEWIAVIRDPIERIKSNFNFEHPENAFLRKDSIALHQSRFSAKQHLYKCFHTIEDLALRGLDGSHPNERCKGSANQLFSGLKGSFPGMSHFTFNFESYFDRLLHRENITLWVVRSEHMMHDINVIDKAMGGRGQITMAKHYSHHRQENVLPVRSRYTSVPAIQNLCRVLCSEIQIYKSIFRKAKNVDIVDFYRDPRSTVAQRCREQVLHNECPSVNFFKEAKGPKVADEHSDKVERKLLDVGWFG